MVPLLEHVLDVKNIPQYHVLGSVGHLHYSATTGTIYHHIWYGLELKITA